jgi:hypothetical protein
MNTDEVFVSIRSQNDVIISLLARLVWKPEEITALVIANKKKDPDAYITVYNELDGTGGKTGKQLGAIAGVSQQAISSVLQTWLDEGIVTNAGTANQPKYKRLMRLPEKKKSKAKSDAQPELEMQEARSQIEIQGTEETDGTNGQ